MDAAQRYLTIMETISKRGAIANSVSICDLYTMAADLEIMQLKVRLLGISPMIWRRVLVEASTSLEELHGMLQVAMGWEGFHLYQFDIRGSMYGSFELGILDPDNTLASFEFRINDHFA
jgi:Plasmid pRiA4b ORF-3-like protein